MKRKRIAATLIVVGILCVLVYLQVRTWKRFDWTTFWSRTDHVNLWYNLAAIGLIYAVYALRALRWRLFVLPMRQTNTKELIAPQFIGFAGLALLGRPGEMVRPYLIARKLRLTFSSQIAVWLVERLFDMGSVALMYVVFAFIGDSMWNWRLHSASLQRHVEWSAELFLAGIVALVLLAVFLRRSGYSAAEFIQRKIAPYNRHVAHSLCGKLKAFTDGLRVIRDLPSFLRMFVWSIVMWVLVAVAYWLVVHSYGGTLAELGPASVLLLMVSSMFGSLIQLPGVGGGSQLATIAALKSIFKIEPELAVSCGMLIWVTTFISVIPAGLLLAHRERISLRAVAEAEQKEEAALVK